MKHPSIVDIVYMQATSLIIPNFQLTRIKRLWTDFQVERHIPRRIRTLLIDRFPTARIVLNEKSPLQSIQEEGSLYSEEMSKSEIYTEDILMCTRLFSGLFSLLLLVQKLIYTSYARTKLLFYFTNVGLIQTAVYFLFAVGYAIYQRKGKIKREIKKIENALNVLYFTGFSTHLFITIAYWTFIADKHTEKEALNYIENWVRIASHVYFSLFLVDMCLNRMIIRVSTTYFSVAFIFVYIAWLLIGAKLHTLENGDLWSPYMRDDITVGYHFLGEMPFFTLLYILLVFLSYTIHNIKQKYTFKISIDDKTPRK
eukprot:GHVP01062283.1.p1 GENE.GHVP01062283.1~~GHVP01062283.1.p1  ORF type:complete len:312 (-),score=25.70 GHVP01062283.1:127-1062(-)